MSTLTAPQYEILRDALGIGRWNTQPRRTEIPGDAVEKYGALVLDEMIVLGLLEEKKIIGQSVVIVYKATEKGIEAAMDPEPNHE